MESIRHCRMGAGAQYFKTRMEAEGGRMSEIRALPPWGGWTGTHRQARGAPGFDSLAGTKHTLTEAVAFYLAHRNDGRESVSSSAVVDSCKRPRRASFSAMHLRIVAIEVFVAAFRETKDFELARPEIEIGCNAQLPSAFRSAADSTSAVTFSISPLRTAPRKRTR